MAQERKITSERLAADPVISSDPRLLADAIELELARKLRQRFLDDVARDKQQGLEFRKLVQQRSSGQWNASYTSVVERAAQQFSGSFLPSETSITLRAARELIVETDDFLVNDIVPYDRENPDSIREWRYLFEYGRFLKGALRNHGVDPATLVGTSLRALKPFVCVFVAGAHNYDYVQAIDRLDNYDECFLEFLDKWDEIQYARGEDPFDVAVKLAQESPVTLLAERSGETSVALVASIAYYLQLMPGPEASIVLPTERIGIVFGKSGDAARQCGSRILKAVRTSGVLLEIKSDWNHRKREAKEHRFNLSSMLCDARGCLTVSSVFPVSQVK